MATPKKFRSRARIIWFTLHSPFGPRHLAPPVKGKKDQRKPFGIFSPCLRFSLRATGDRSPPAISVLAAHPSVDADPPRIVACALGQVCDGNVEGNTASSASLLSHEPSFSRRRIYHFAHSCSCMRVSSQDVPRLRCLRKMTIIATPVADEGVAHITEHLQGLTEFGVGHNANITRVDLPQLEQAPPNAEKIPRPLRLVNMSGLRRRRRFGISCWKGVCSLQAANLSHLLTLQSLGYCVLCD